MEMLCLGSRRQKKQAMNFSTNSVFWLRLSKTNKRGMILELTYRSRDYQKIKKRNMILQTAYLGRNLRMLMSTE